MSKNKINQAFVQLSSAALVLLGNSSQVQAAFQEGGPNASYRYSNYKEDNVNGSERYNIDIQQLHYFQPVNDDNNVGINFTNEKMSGASPWYIVPDTNGKPIQVMSGATIKEQRDDLSGNLSHKMGDTTLSGTLGHSGEHDYKANYLKLSADHEVKSKQFSVFGGVALSRDEIHPTAAEFYGRIKSATKQSNCVFAGVSIIVNRDLLLSSTISYTKLDGFLTDPYKMVRIVDGSGNAQIINENRPNSRTEWAWTNKLRYYLGNDTSLHLDYRYFKDDWEITSQTVSTALYKTIYHSWQFIPELRYYNQARAYFYAPYYNGERADGYYSGDYRLSPYGAISGRLKVVKTLGRYRVNLAYERYNSDGNYALKKVKIENPSLVDFWVLTAGLDIDF